MNRFPRAVIAALTVIVLLPAAELQAQKATLAATPPIGWNSWNLFACKVSDAVVRAAADAMATNGMKDAGYVYINIDDCWQGQRDAAGNIQGNERFPDMKALADYVHGKGLKIGIYSSPGPKTCAGYEGSYQHEEQDARTYAAWGFDYLKYDWCSADKVYKNSDMPAVYKKMGDALKASGRPIVYSLCQYGVDAVWTWGAQSGGNLWRTTRDIEPNYNSIVALGFVENNGLERFAGPGHWNDPDMLEVGNGQLTLDENRLHMSQWALLAAPLLAGNDLSNTKPEILSILSNREVIAINQDPLGMQGHRVWRTGPIDVWIKPLADGSKAVGIYNTGEPQEPVTVQFRDLGLGKSANVRLIWEGKDLGRMENSFTTTVPPHGVVLLKVK
jgi:alpha-galactosidase